MIEKKDVEFFGYSKVVIFNKPKPGFTKGFVNAGLIKHIGSSCLVIFDEVKKQNVTVNFCDIEEIRQDGR